MQVVVKGTFLDVADSAGDRCSRFRAFRSQTTSDVQKYDRTPDCEPQYVDDGARWCRGTLMGATLPEQESTEDGCSGRPSGLDSSSDALGENSDEDVGAAVLEHLAVRCGQSAAATLRPPRAERRRRQGRAATEQQAPCRQEVEVVQGLARGTLAAPMGAPVAPAALTPPPGFATPPPLPTMAAAPMPTLGVAAATQLPLPLSLAAQLPQLQLPFPPQPVQQPAHVPYSLLPLQQPLQQSLQPPLPLQQADVGKAVDPSAFLASWVSMQPALMYAALASARGLGGYPAPDFGLTPASLLPGFGGPLPGGAAAPTATMAPPSPFVQLAPSLASSAGHQEPEPAAEGHTTVMLRNLPNNYTRRMMVDLLNVEGFAGRYDFLYIPHDFKTNAGLGFAFLNLCTTEDATRLREHFSGFKRWAIPSAKVCSVNWSGPEQQGLRANVERYRNSSVMHESVPEECKPLMLSNGVPVPFPKPTRKLWPPHENFGVRARRT